MKALVLNAYTRSISTVWIVMTPIVGAGFIMGMSRRSDQSSLSLTKERNSSVVCSKVYVAENDRQVR